MLQYLNIKRLLWFFIHYYSYCVCLIDKSFKIIENWKMKKNVVEHFLIFPELFP